MIGDDRYRELNHSEQWLYKLLLVHPTLTYAGVAEWRPGRLAATTSDLNADDVRRIGSGLQAKYFIYIDEDTEEVFIRSFVKHDGLLKQFRLPLSMTNDYAGIASQAIREFFIFELQKYQQEEPTLKCWDMERVKSLLERSSRNMKEQSYGDALPITFDEGYADPYGKGYADPYGKGYGIDPSESYGLPTATTTATATSNTPPKTDGDTSTSKRGTRVNPEWTPKEMTVKGISKELPQVDQSMELKTFIDHFLAAPGQKGLKVDWDATYRNWVRNSVKYGTAAINNSANQPLKGFNF